MQIDQSAKKNKVLVIGVDGISYSAIEKIRDEMPEFKECLENSCSGILHSTIPPTSPVAWPTSYTGKNPGKIGIGGLFKKKSTSNSWEPVDTNDCPNKTIWDIASEFNKKSIVIGMPYTYPPRRINGIMVGGHFTYNIQKAVYPEN